MYRSIQLVAVSILWLLGLGLAHADCENTIPPRNPDVIYVDHGDGTVTDLRTGLMWRQCAEGLSGPACAEGQLDWFTWSAALLHVENSHYAGYSDWRVPNRKELRSLVELCRTEPSINTRLFPNTPATWFWSASPYAGGSDSAWGVDFNYGNDYWDGGSGGRVRLVRGGQ